MAHPRSIEGLWCVANVTGEKRHLAHVTHSRPARPISWDIAGLGELQEAFEPAIPWHRQPGTSKRDRWPISESACGRGDIAGALNTLTDDVVWFIPGPKDVISFLAQYQCRQQGADFLRKTCGEA